MSNSVVLQYSKKFLNQAVETKFLSQFFFYSALNLTFIPTITLPVKLMTQNINVTNSLLDILNLYKQMQGIIGIIYLKKSQIKPR